MQASLTVLFVISSSLDSASTSGIPNLPDRYNGSISQHIEITHQDILNQLDQLKTNRVALITVTHVY